MEILFLRAWPRNAATAAESVVRLAGGGAGRAYHLGGAHYRAGLVSFPRFAASIGIDESGFTGRTVPASAQIAFAPSDVAMRDQLLALHWQKARLEIDAADESITVPPRLLTGVVDDLSFADGQFQLAIADGSQRFDNRILGSPFAGTGGIEGYSGAAGRPKRRSWGQVWNVEGRLLDPANNIWEFGDPAFPLNAITTLKDLGRAGGLATIGWQGSIAATLAALVASVPAQGGGVAAPSIACAKWWTQPAGPLTADIEGEVGAGYVATAPAIASRLIELAGGTAISNLATAIGWRNGPAGWHVDRDTSTWAEALDGICLGVSLLWIVNPDGTVTLRQCSFTDPAASLKAVFISRDRTLAPMATRKLTYKINNRPHSDGEISAAILASDIDGLGALATQNSVNLGTQVTGQLPTGNAAAGLVNNNIGILPNGTLTGAGGGAVTISGLGFVGDLGATSGDNLIRNASLANDATGWVVALGTAARVTSAVAGEMPAYFRATGAANLIALNNGELIPVRPGATLYYSFAARADIVSQAGGGANARRIYVRQTFYNAAGASLGTVDTSDATKVALTGDGGGCGTSWNGDAGGFHTCFSVAPANSARVKVELFPLLGSTGAGKFIDVTQPVMGVAQAGADQTIPAIRTIMVADKASEGENLIRNGSLASDAAGWLLNSTSWGGNGTVWSNAGGYGHLLHTAAGTSAVFPNCRPDRTAPNNLADMTDVIAGRDVTTSFQYASDGSCTASIDHWFYSATGTQIAAASGAVTGSANTSGALTSVTGKVTVPAGAVKMFHRVVLSKGAGSYVRMTNFRSGHSEPGATVGAVAGVNLKDSGGTTLNDAAIKNSAISISAGGALTGAGGGAVTISGLGYVGDLNADRFAGSAADTKLAGVEANADVTKTAQVVVAAPPPQTVMRDWQGSAKAGQLPRTLTPTVTKGGASIRTDNATSYAISATGVTATVNNTNGSADKGRIEITAGGPGSISLTVTRDGVAYGPFAIPVSVEDDAPPNNQGGGGGSDSTLESVNSTGFVQMTSAGSGEAIFTATISAGQSLVGTAPLTYNWTHSSSSGSNKLVAKWQYKPSGGGWTDFAAAITGSAAEWFANDFSGSPGSGNFNQTKSGLAAGTYEVRLVGAKETSSGNAITIASGTATLSVS